MEPGSRPARPPAPKPALQLDPRLLAAGGVVLLLLIVGAILFLVVKPGQGADPTVQPTINPNAAPIYPNASKLPARATFKNLISEEFLKTSTQNLTETEYVSPDTFDKIVVYLDRQAAQNGWKKVNLNTPRDPAAPGILYTYTKGMRTIIYAFLPITSAPKTAATPSPDGTYFTVTTFDSLPTATPDPNATPGQPTTPASTTASTVS